MIPRWAAMSPLFAFRSLIVGSGQISLLGSVRRKQRPKFQQVGWEWTCYTVAIILHWRHLHFFTLHRSEHFLVVSCLCFNFCTLQISAFPSGFLPLFQFLHSADFSIFQWFPTSVSIFALYISQYFPVVSYLCFNFWHSIDFSIFQWFPTSVSTFALYRSQHFPVVFYRCFCPEPVSWIWYVPRFSLCFNHVVFCK